MIIAYKKIADIFFSLFKKYPIAKKPSVVPSLGTPEIKKISHVPGSLPAGNYSYRITALNEYGETTASQQSIFYNGTSLPSPVLLDGAYIAGNLKSGVYSYAVSAIGANGETLTSNIITKEINGMPSPIMDEFAYKTTGNLLKGNYYYRVTAVSSQGETLPTTIYEATVVNDNSSVIIKWLEVEGAVAYKVYGRSKESQKLISIINGKINTFFEDDGSVIPSSPLPSTNTTTGGIKITWGMVADAKGYRIYGRNKSALYLISEVGENVCSFSDDGTFPLTQTLPPEQNTTGIISGGAKLEWDKVPNAVGYRIYGRILNSEMLLTDVPDGESEFFIDDGTIEGVKNTFPPSIDTTNGRYGSLGMVIPDSITLDINDNGIMSVKNNSDSILNKIDFTNLNDGDSLIFDKINNKWVPINLNNLIAMYISDPIPPTLDFKDAILDLLTINRALKDTNEELEDKVLILENKITQIELAIGLDIKGKIDA